MILTYNDQIELLNGKRESLTKAGALCFTFGHFFHCTIHRGHVISVY